MTLGSQRKDYSLFWGTSNTEEVWVWTSEDAREGWRLLPSIRRTIVSVRRTPCNVGDCIGNEKWKLQGSKFWLNMKEEFYDKSMEMGYLTSGVQGPRGV